MNKNRQFAIEVVQRLRQAGFDALWAGGCVRDELVGRTPKDYDVATSAEPEQVRQTFGHRRTLAIGAAFGVITVRGPKGVEPIEVATFRKDAEYSDGRRPDAVVYSSAEEDAKRRDFTINGLFYDPLEERVIDYVGGQLDMQRKVVRAIGNPHERIAEDKLRMLRAVRFAATFEFELDAETADAVTQHAPEIRVVSAERIATEMRRMLLHGKRHYAVQLLVQTGLLDELLGDAAPPREVWNDTMSMLSQLVEPSTAVCFAVLMRHVCCDGGEPSPGQRVEQLGRAWKLTNEEIAGWALCYKYEEVLRQALTRPWPEVQRSLVHPRINELLAYCHAVQSLVGPSESLAFCEQRLAWPAEQLNPPILLSGDDLIRAGGKPGPAFKSVLEHVRDEQLEGRIQTAEDALRAGLKYLGE